VIIKKRYSKNSILIIVSFFSIYVIWGSTYFAILMGLEGFPPFMLASFRFAIAGIILTTYCYLKQPSIPNNVSILKNSILGLIVLVGGQGMIIWAEQFISSGNTAVIVSSLPMWYIILDKSNRRSYFSNKFIISGIIIGFIGIAFLFFDQLKLEESKSFGRMTFLGYFAVILSMFCWVSGTLYHRNNIKTGSILTNLSWQLITASVIGLFISYFSGEFKGFSLSKVSFESWIALLYLAIAGSLIAFTAYTWLLTQRPAVIVGTYAYINPIIAVFLGWMVANESVSKLQIFAMLIIFFSAYIINRNKIKENHN
jgi:drug/metabolite transporter (DMT)-like permease